MIGENLNVNRCPQADHPCYECSVCRVKDMFDEHIDCPHNCVGERGERWWEKKEFLEFLEKKRKMKRTIIAIIVIILIILLNLLYSLGLIPSGPMLPWTPLKN